MSDNSENLVYFLFEDTDNDILRVVLVVEFGIEKDAFLLLYLCTFPFIIIFCCPTVIFQYQLHGNFLVEVIMTHHILFICNHIFFINNV